MLRHVRTLRLLLSLLAAALLAPGAALAQQPADDGVQETGTIGLHFQVPGIAAGRSITSLPGGVSRGTVGGSYFLSPSAAVRANLGLGITLEPDTDFAFQIGGGYRMYHGLTERVAPFLEPGASLGWVGESLRINGYFDAGAEYFFNDQLSLSGAIGVQLSLFEGFDAAAFSTVRSALELSIYW